MYLKSKLQILAATLRSRKTDKSYIQTKHGLISAISTVWRVWSGHNPGSALSDQSRFWTVWRYGLANPNRAFPVPIPSDQISFQSLDILSSNLRSSCRKQPVSLKRSISVPLKRLPLKNAQFWLMRSINNSKFTVQIQFSGFWSTYIEHDFELSKMNQL